jgi:hypothetical protein
MPIHQALWVAPAGGGGCDPNSLFHWRANDDDGGGDLDLADVSTYARTITLSGSGPDPTPAAGLFAEAALMGSTTKHFLADNSDDLLTFGTDDFTIEAWVYATDVSSINRGLLSTRPTGGFNNGWYLNIVNGKLTFQAADNNILSYAGLNPQSPDPFPLNEWVHVAAVRESGVFRMFEHGVLVDERAVGNIGDSGSLYIGADPFELFVPLDGRVDEVRLSSVARYWAAFTPPSSPFPGCDD